MKLSKIEAEYEKFRRKIPFSKDYFPNPIYEKEPGFVSLYWEAWKSAWRHILHREDMVQNDYMDEAMFPDRIWIWDSCFMALFARYAFEIVPGIQSLDNLYSILYDQHRSGVKIHFADNPPIFSWVEWEYFKFTGDRRRLDRLLREKRYLQKHYEYMRKAKKMPKIKNVLVKSKALEEDVGYRWQGNHSGMDNTPRGRTRWNNTKLNHRGQIVHNNIYWVDLLAQQALSSRYIAIMSKLVGAEDDYAYFSEEYNRLRRILNDWYWSRRDGFYYDIVRKKVRKMIGKYDSTSHDSINPGKPVPEWIFNKVKTPASYWPMLAMIPDDDMAEKMALHAADSREFGGTIPWPSLARSDPEFDPTGRYWRGGVWLPTAYMAIKSLERYNYHRIAAISAKNLLKHMMNTFRSFSPQSIWEAYSPTSPAPSTVKTGKGYVRDDFCGWSALGPISLFIENVLGFEYIAHSAMIPGDRARPDTEGITLNKMDEYDDNPIIRWRIHHPFRHGLERIHVGDATISLIYNHGNISIKTDREFVLEYLFDPFEDDRYDDMGALISRNVEKFNSIKIPKGSMKLEL